MLKQDENELITRVGPGTPMGNFMRAYWVPAMLSSEVPTPDSDPVRILRGLGRSDPRAAPGVRRAPRAGPRFEWSPVR
jgi:hypothetical protein